MTQFWECREKKFLFLRKAFQPLFGVSLADLSERGQVLESTGWSLVSQICLSLAPWDWVHYLIVSPSLHFFICKLWIITAFQTVWGFDDKMHLSCLPQSLAFCKHSINVNYCCHYTIDQWFPHSFSILGQTPIIPTTVSVKKFSQCSQRNVF